MKKNNKHNLFTFYHDRNIGCLHYFKNMGVLVQFIVFPGMAFVMTHLVGMRIDNLPNSFLSVCLPVCLSA